MPGTPEPLNPPCAAPGRAESVAFRNTVAASAVDGLMMGAGSNFALVTLGAVREILGAGTPLSHAEALLDSSSAFLGITVIPDY